MPEDFNHDIVILTRLLEILVLEPESLGLEPGGIVLVPDQNSWSLNQDQELQEFLKVRLSEGSRTSGPGSLRQADSVLRTAS